MLQPLMALLAVASLGSAGGTATPPRCTVDSDAGPITVLRAEDCAELTRLREQRDTLRQRLGGLQRELGERATGGSGEQGVSEPPPPPPAAAVEARPPEERSAVTEELRALRREVAELRQSLSEAEARRAAPVEAPKAEPPAREEKSEREEALELLRNTDMGDRLLLQGDAYYVNPLGADEASVNASVGTGVRVGRAFVVTGAVGVNATSDDVAPRLLFGVLGRI